MLKTRTPSTERRRRDTMAGSTSPRKPSVPPEKKSDTSTYSGRIGARIRATRKSREMSVEAFRDALRQRGIDMATSRVYAIENGTRYVDVNHLPAIAAVLGCKVLELLPPK